MSCTIFDKNLIFDADFQTANINLDKLRTLIPAYNSIQSGLWQPIVIRSNDSNAVYCEPLAMAGAGSVPGFSPCNCNNNSLGIVTDNALDSLQDSSLGCSYCGSPNTTSWYLKDKTGASYGPISSLSCCDGSCDVRAKKDDYITKIPVLDQTQISGTVDWKYMNQFPACNNAGLGFEQFITITGLSTISGADLCIDWKLKERISEIEYNKISTQYSDQYIHDKMFTKAKLISQTCGHFIMTRLNPTHETTYSSLYPRLSGLIGSQDEYRTLSLPSVEQFSRTPYGFDKQTYNNIFINNQKIASYWKWNYTSGIIGWYRHYDIDRQNDTRPLAGIDLYISPGDIFFATNDGPEPEPKTQTNNTPEFIKTCPSGLKVVVNNAIDCVIPSGSEFMYVSSNIYSQFYNLYNSLLDLNENDTVTSLAQAALLATAPKYDKVVVDLLKTNVLEESTVRNEFNQLDELNKHMSTTTTYDSVSHLNFISTKEELISTLANKYGAYLWVPPNAKKDIAFNIPLQSDSFYIDLTFDMVIKNSDVTLRPGCSQLKACGSKTYNKSFFYDQTISVGTTSLSTSCFDDIRHKQSCSAGVITKSDFTNYSTLYLNNARIKSVSSGPTCISFLDNYPRIVDPNNIKNYCTDCDKVSSYYLVPNANLAACRNNNFCYATLAKLYNINAPEDEPLNLTEREISDNAFRYFRSYNARFFNPAIELIAFHKDNGVFYRSKAFGSDRTIVFDRNNANAITGRPKITFTTKDLGIKLYHLYAEKLQSGNQSVSCKRFPVELNTCKCYGLNISDFNNYPYSCNGNKYAYADVFLPGLSTKNSPTLYKYGGYSQQELDVLFGPNTIVAGGTLPILTNKIIPDQPYGCERSVSINLKNYVNTEWQLDITGLTNDHSDVTLGVSEYGDLAESFVRYIYNDEYFQEYNNEAWKRFFTKVTIIKEDKSQTILFKDQIKTLISNTDSLVQRYEKSLLFPFTVQLQNPYLQALTNVYNARIGSATRPYITGILMPRSGDLVSGGDMIFGQPVSYGTSNLTSRGDETSTVTLSFKNRPRKQILTFSLSPPNTNKFLQRGFFHPNSGLITNDYTDRSPIKDGAIYYDEPLYNDGYSAGCVLIGDLDDEIKSLFNKINDFDIHKKAKLYLYVRNSWFRVDIHNRGGFKHLNSTFVGPPTYFEYVHHVRDSKNIPGLFPIPPKQHTQLFFVANHPTSFNSKTTKKNITLFEKFTESRNRTIILPGSRYYFMVPESDPAIPVAIDKINDIASISDELAVQIVSGKMIILNDGTRWLSTGEDPKLFSSYVFTDYGYLYQNFSDLHIDYGSINDLGYIYNTQKITNHNVHIYNSRGERENNIVLQKELFVVYDTPRISTSTSIDVQKYKIFTKFVLQNKIRAGYSWIDPLLIKEIEDSEENIRQYSMTVFAPTLWLQAETDYYLNDVLKTKWGDVIYYDGNILNPLNMNIVDPSYWYPTPLYNNSFYKLIVNDHKQNNHKYRLSVLNNNQTYDFNHDDLVYYNIHQKYNTTYDNRSYATTINDYQNYLPFMDINFVSTTKDAEIRGIDPLLFNSDTQISGTMIANGLYNELPDNHNWQSFLDPQEKDRFWINLAHDAQLVSAFVPKSTIYSTTLRIDDPIYWIDKTYAVREFNSDQMGDCTKTFETILPTIASSVNNYFPDNMRVVTNNRTKKFYSVPIYCDTDQQTPDCGHQPCLIKNVGSGSLNAVFKIGSNVTLPLSSIPTNVDIPYFISYDAGNYNAFGSKSLIQIKRCEITPDSWLDTDNSCSSNTLKPLNLRNSIIDSRYQNALTEPDNHSTLVKNTDEMANEILFRMLYGEQYPINKTILLNENNTLIAKNLIDYSDPDITAKDIYDQILYSYDRNVVSDNTLYNSTLTISGPLSIGKSINMTIGTTPIELTISKETSEIESAVVVKGKIGDKEIYGKLYIEKYQENSLIVVDGDVAAPEPSSEDETIELVQTIINKETYHWSSYSWPDWGYNGKYEGWWFLSEDLQDLAVTYSPESTTQSVAENAEYLRSRDDCEIVENTAGLIWDPGEYLANVIPAPRVGTFSRPIKFRCTDNFDQCKDFQYAYCRRNRDQSCASCKDTFVKNDGVDFEYDFSVCRHSLQLYGHTYREQHFEDISNDAVSEFLTEPGSIAGSIAGSSSEPLTDCRVHMPVYDEKYTVEYLPENFPIPGNYIYGVSEAFSNRSHLRSVNEVDYSFSVNNKSEEFQWKNHYKIRGASGELQISFDTNNEAEVKLELSIFGYRKVDDPLRENPYGNILLTGIKPGLTEFTPELSSSDDKRHILKLKPDDIMTLSLTMPPPLPYNARNTFETARYDIKYWGFRGTIGRDEGGVPYPADGGFYHATGPSKVNARSVVTPGLGRGCLDWNVFYNCPPCAYSVIDNFKDNRKWSENCILRKCLKTPRQIRKIYHKKSIKRLPAYEANCPSTLCTITYNNYSINITYPNVSISTDHATGQISQMGNKTECILYAYLAACPRITLNSFPKDFIIQESIGSECSACNQPPLKINILPQNQKFATIKEKRKCIVSTFVYGTINDKPLIRFGTFRDRGCVQSTGPNSPVVPGWYTAQCGGGYEWLACLGSLSYKEREKFDNFGIQRQKLANESRPYIAGVNPAQAWWDWHTQIISGNNSASWPLAWRPWFYSGGGCNADLDDKNTLGYPTDILCEFSVPAMAEGPAAVKQMEEWKASVNESYTNGSRGRENVHIPENDIVEGIVPGSQSADIQYKTYAFKSWKIRPNTTATGSEVKEWYVNVVVAYYDYEYIRPKTIQDILKPPGVVCYQQKTIDPPDDIIDPALELELPQAPPDGGNWDFVGQVNRTGQYQCWSLPFPSWFSLPGWSNWWGWYNLPTPKKPKIPDTFVLTKNYIRSDGCTNNIQSYYNHTPMPCSSTDWNCWANQDMKTQFLSAKTGQIWI